MKETRKALHELERRADTAELNENHDTARLLRRSVAVVEAAMREDERRLHQCLEEELDLRTAASRTGIAYSTLARRVSQGDIPDVGVGRGRKVRVADLPCEAGWLPKLMGLSPEGDSIDDPDDHLDEAVSADELAAHRRERLRRIG